MAELPHPPASPSSRSPIRAGSRWLPVVLLFLGCASASLRDVPGFGGIRGQLRVLHGGDAALPSAVVYLAREGRARPPRSGRVLRVGWPPGGSEPVPAATALGRSLELVNTGSLHHRVFALVPGGRLEFDLAPGARARSAPALVSGILRVYCHLHPDESLPVFVAPTPHFAVTDARGRYTIRGVPPGRWRLEVWTEPAAGLVRSVEIGPWGLREADVFLDARRFEER